MRYENVAPMEYFANLVNTFEMQMSDYRKQIDQTERHLQVPYCTPGPPYIHTWWLNLALRICLTLG